MNIFNSAWISNYIHYDVWNLITSPIPTSNVASGYVGE